MFVVVMILRPVTATVVEHRIVYDVPSTIRGIHVLHAVAYIVAVCGSCLASSRRWIVGFGLAALTSAAIAYPFYREAFASVWCFFAAILSSLIFFHFMSQRLEFRRESTIVA